MQTDEIKNKYRYELKYVCTDLQLMQIEERVRALLEKDSHAGNKGYYSIRSLYFDDYYDSCFWDKENGTDNRKKFRIRMYDVKTSHLSLEIKTKRNNKIMKEREIISLDEYHNLIDTESGLPIKKECPVQNQLHLLKAMDAYRPVVIVEYDRIPYIGTEGNVRVTFDKNIRSSSEVNRFLEKDIPMRGIMPDGNHLLEVKFDEFLPDYIYRGLNLENMIHTSFSKYYLCRKFI